MVSITYIIIILRVGNSKIIMFRAVSKILSCWENTASRIARVSKVGSTFGSTFPRKVARENPPPPPTTPDCNNIPDIYQYLEGSLGDFYWQVVVESLKLTNKADRNQK